jgi:hypothetical protein
MSESPPRWLFTVPAKSAWSQSPRHCKHPGCKENAVMVADWVLGPDWCNEHRDELIAAKGRATT